LQSETAIAATAAEAVESTVKSPLTWLSLLKTLRPETVLLMAVFYLLVRPELSGFCIGG